MVAASVVLVSVFLVAFIRPTKPREWSSLGLAEAFAVSLFTEMFGVPLTIYFLSSFLGLPLSPEPLQGHLLAAILALIGVWRLETGVFVVMVVSAMMLILATYLVAEGWREVYNANGELVTTNLYGIVRHPQYLGILLASVAFLIQWPTIPTLIMSPILFIAYYKLARREEIELEAKFGDNYRRYKLRVPMMVPFPRQLDRSRN
jgi:protein-S-isoprenylcysteine O-methyltransferase Ste14